MDYSSSKAKRSQRKPRKSSRSKSERGRTESSHDSKLASKLFSYLICHGDDCRLPIDKVAKRLRSLSEDRSYDSKKALEFVNYNYREKFVVKNVEGSSFVEAKTSVKICDAFQDGKCRSRGCKGLHICRFFLEGNCKFGDECKKPHGFDNLQTKELLAQHKLENLPTEALTTLFQKVLNENKIKHAFSSFGQSVCKFYNKGGVCKNGDGCEFLHVCGHYIDGDCKFGAQRCKRPHNFDSKHSRKVLAAHRLGEFHNQRQIRTVLQNRRALSLDLDSSDDDDDLVPSAKFPRVNLPEGSFTCDRGKGKQTSPTQPVFHSTDGDDSASEKTEICGFNLRGKCSYGNKCKSFHTSLPYQWQYCYRSQWKNVSVVDNRDVENEFCDHKADGVKFKVSDLGYLNINFQRMDGEIADGRDVRVLQVRRLSTVSSVLAASGHVFRTTWKWYWQDEHGQWNCYDNGNSNITSEEIEQQFQSVSGERKQTFSVGSNVYTLYFGDERCLYQQNNKSETKRDVRRRPGKYLDEKIMKLILEDFKRNRQRAMSLSSVTPSYPVPSTWSPVDSSEEFKVVELSEILHRDEYTNAKAQFLKTMNGFKVKSVKRVQNPSLWEDYERKRSRIAKKNSDQSPEERWLFHGTRKDIVEPICQQGFDWRLSGSKHGAVYGKGSYFAVEASYSHKYSSTETVQGCYSIFMAKVIVGSYVRGSQETQRPPPKDPSDSLSPLHDSCVNNVVKPTIFVVFERSQAYPYYIIDYTN